MDRDYVVISRPFLRGLATSFFRSVIAALFSAIFLGVGKLKHPGRNLSNTWRAMIQNGTVYKIVHGITFVTLPDRTFTQHFYCILSMNDIHWVELFYLKLRRFDSEITLHLCIPLKVSVSQNITKY